MYSNPEAIKKEACREETDIIQELNDEYYLDGYFSREEIIKCCEYDRSYCSCYGSRIKQKNKILEEIDHNEDLSWLKENGSAFINKILYAYDKRIEDAEREDKENCKIIKDNYSKHLLVARKKTVSLYRDACNRKEKDLEALIKHCDCCDDIEELRCSIHELRKFKEFEIAKEYANYCEGKINQLKEKKEIGLAESEIDLKLKDGKKLLLSEEYSKAYEVFKEITLIDPNNGKAYLGILEAKWKVNDENALFECYEDLYSDDSLVMKEACKADAEQIDEMVRKYAVSGYLEEKEIRDLYRYDFSYWSSLDYRIQEYELFIEKVRSDPAFLWLENNGQLEIKDKIHEVYKTYEDRIKEAEKEDETQKEKVINDYHRFLITAYVNIKKKYKEACKRKERDYQALVKRFKSDLGEKELCNLINDLRDFGDYKDIDRYVLLCIDKINWIKEKRKKEEIERKAVSLAEDGQKDLAIGEFETAKEKLNWAYEHGYRSPYLFFSLRMAESGAQSEEELVNYYKDLYSNAKTELVPACKPDLEHIKGICERYQIPGYLDKKEIILLYRFMRYYESDARNKYEQKERIVKEFENDPYLKQMMDMADDHIKSLYSEILTAYDQRIKEMEMIEESRKSSAIDIYRHYLSECDKKVFTLYEIRYRQKMDDLESVYKKNIERFNCDLGIPELMDLAKAFNPDYKDSKTYVRLCYERIEAIDRKKKKDEIDALFNHGVHYLRAKKYDFAANEFESYLKKVPESEKGYLYLLMAKEHVETVDSLFEHYLNLYYSDKYVLKEAVKEDNERIREISNLYYPIPAYFGEDVLKELYAFNRFYKSCYELRVKENQQILDKVNHDYSLLWLARRGSKEIRKRIFEVLKVYEQRVIAAKKHDESEIKRITEEYAAFLEKKDAETKTMYQGLVQKRED